MNSKVRFTKGVRKIYDFHEEVDKIIVSSVDYLKICF